MSNRVKQKWQEPKGAIELLEEAVELLRRAPASALAAYYLGSVPFGLGVLYFWADMSRSSEAYEILAQEAFGMALLFLWMKLWQTFSTRILWAHLSQTPEPRWTPGRMVRALLTQISIQPWGFIAIPAAFLAMIPFPWVYAYFQNITILGDGLEKGSPSLSAKAWKLAGVWPRQNTILLLCVHFFGIFVLLNLATFLSLGPYVLKEFLGIETLFSRNFYGFIFNTTFWAIVFALTYLCTDPLLKAAYTLRCFYGESLLNGEDLKAELKISASLSKVFLFMLLTGWGCSLTLAQIQPVSPLSQEKRGEGVVTVHPPELDRSIEETLKGEEYRWHMPRVKPPETKTKSEPGIFYQFLESSLKFFIRCVKKVGHWLDEFFTWLGKLFRANFKPDRQVKSDQWNFEWLYGFLWVLLAVVLCALALLLYRVWNRRGKKEVLSQAVLPKPDVADERVTGSELPMDEWLKMAQDLLRQGQFRLALRAFYLASLACLARQKLLSIAKFKSTLDYERELNRRGHSFPQLLAAFSENGKAFDKGWYGNYEVTQEIVRHFADNHEKIRTTVEQKET
jgi:hypothetical protein